MMVLVVSIGMRNIRQPAAATLAHRVLAAVGRLRVESWEFSSSRTLQTVTPGTKWQA